jgi:hypothetical protein
MNDSSPADTFQPLFQSWTTKPDQPIRESAGGHT